MKGVVGTPPTASASRGRSPGEEPTLSNSRVYRPLPTARTSLPGAASSPPKALAADLAAALPKPPAKAHFADALGATAQTV